MVECHGGKEKKSNVSPGNSMVSFMFESDEYECQYQSQAEGSVVVRAAHMRILEGRGMESTRFQN